MRTVSFIFLTLLGLRSATLSPRRVFCFSFYNLLSSYHPKRHADTRNNDPLPLGYNYFNFTGSGTSVFVKDVAGAAFLHAWSGGVQAIIFGNDPAMGMLGGAVSSYTASLMPESLTNKMGLLGNFALGGASSALTSLVTKGDPMQAFIIGGGVAAFNHFMHSGEEIGEDGMTQSERNAQDPLLVTKAFLGLVDFFADAVNVGVRGIVSASKWVVGKYVARQTAKNVSKKALVNLASARRTAHIIAGDATGGGLCLVWKFKKFYKWN